VSDSSKGLQLLPASALIRTSEVDHADWNYRKLLGQIQRLRFRIVRGLLGEAHFPRILELGYGSGVFMPELAHRCDELYGIDPHPKQREVTEVLARHGIRAELHSGSAESLPFPDGHFDAIVSVSALEYVPDIERCCREMRRVLKPGGTLVICTPGFSPLLDLALRVGTGESANQYSDRRERLLPTLKRHFTTESEKSFPPFAGRLVRLYTGIRLRCDPASR
jgi:ubiquinone/menaquinone biosynthesis C-methylase UbiE